MDNKELLASKTVFDKSKLRVGSVIEIQDDRINRDLIAYHALVRDVELEEIDVVYVDPDSRQLQQRKIHLYELSDETSDGYSIKVVK